MCSLLCQPARGISGCLRVGSCVVDVPVLMRAYYLTPQDALFSIPYVWLTALANYFSEMVKRRLDVSQGRVSNTARTSVSIISMQIRDIFSGVNSK